VYTDPRVVEFIRDNVLPVRVHVKQNSDQFKKLGEKYNAQWTPTILILDRDGNERHRIEGFLPADEFLPQLEIGTAHASFARLDHADAERRFRAIVDKYPQSDVAAEAQYWAGVSKYKASGDAAALKDTARAFKERYADSAWAKKASVWAAP
jgi:TolA-binding protein